MASNQSELVSGHYALVKRTMAEGDFNYPKRSTGTRLPDWESLVAGRMAYCTSPIPRDSL